MKANNKLKPGDIYCEQERRTGNYFAYQLIKILEDNISYLLLDYFGKELPGKKTIPAMKPFRRQRWFFKEDSIDYCYSGSAQLPTGAIYVGNRKPMVYSLRTLLEKTWP